MTYLLDTNACIALINGRPEGLRRRFAAVVAAGATVATSSVVLYELWYGVAKSRRQAENSRKVEAFLRGPLAVFAFSAEDARLAGNARATAERAGRPLGAYDLLIAGQALRIDATVVTANHREVGRVRGLRWEDWTRST